jgi:hypothetical protein
MKQEGGGFVYVGVVYLYITVTVEQVYTVRTTSYYCSNKYIWGVQKSSVVEPEPEP